MHMKKITQKDRYGNQVSIEYEQPEKQLDPTALMKHQMDKMMDVPPPVMGEEFNMGNPATHPGEPRGEDTVPAWLTPGEFVVNAEATQMFGPQIEAMNEVGRMAKGGEVQYHGMGDIVRDSFYAAAKEDPRAASELIASMPDKLQMAQDLMGYLYGLPILGFNEGGDVPAPPIPPWAGTPEGLDDMLHEREGFKDYIYTDHLGKPTTGAGHLLTPEELAAAGLQAKMEPNQHWKDKKIEGDLHEMFGKDRDRAVDNAVNYVGRDTWVNLPVEQQRALASMAFQLGGAGQKKFKNMLEAIKAGDNKRVAREALTNTETGENSKWYRQTPKRAWDLAHAFDPDFAAEYKNAGGVVYAEDGQEIPWWGHLLGDKGKEMAGLDQPVAEVPAIPDDVPMIDDESSTPAPAVVEDDGKPWWAGEAYGDPYVTMTGNMGRHFTEEDMGEGSQADFDEQVAAGVAESQEYKDHVARAESAGVMPTPPQAWMDKSMSGALERSAPMSDTSQIEASVTAADEAGQAAIMAGLPPEEVADVAQEAADNAKPADDSKPKMTDEEAISTLDQILNDNDVGSGPGADQKGPEGNATQIEETGKGDTAGTKKAESMLGNLFGDLFDKKELARMAVMYAGSRALGYSHGGSLQWAAKQYVNRVDTKNATMDKFAADNVGKFTAESLDAFKESGNYSDLVAVGTPPVSTGEFKTFYGKNGKPIQAQKYKVGDNVVWMDSTGKQLNQNYKTQDPKAATREYMSHTTDQLKSLRNQFDKFGEGDNIAYKTDINPATDSGKIAEWAYANNIPPEQLTGLVQSAYQEAINDNRQDKSRVRSLVPYLNNLVIRQSTSNPDAFLAKGQGKEGAPPQYIDGQKMTALNSGAALLMKSNGKQGDDYDLTNQFYDAVLSDWNALPESERKQWQAKANDDVNGFYLYATSIVNSKLGG